MNQNDFQALLAVAIKNEIEAQHFYRAAGEKLKEPFLKQLFSQFVEEEEKHQQILENYRASAPTDFHFAQTPDFHVSETESFPKVTADMKPAEAFRLAMKKEEEAMRLYMSFAQATTDSAKKKVFTELAAMEREHKNRMETAFVDIGYPEVW